MSMQMHCRLIRAELPQGRAPTGSQYGASKPALRGCSSSDECPRKRPNDPNPGLETCGRTTIQMTDAGSVPCSTTTTPDKDSCFVILKNPAGPRATRGFPFFACGLGRIFWASNPAVFGRFSLSLLCSLRYDHSTQVHKGNRYMNQYVKRVHRF
jgi:hypothetical protein